MLDYAANGQANWPAGRNKETASKSAVSSGTDLDTVTFKLIEPEYSDEDWLDESVGAMGSRVDEFWDQVDNNLADGRLRLVFVATTIPRELQTIVDFLNSQMEKTDVAAVEIKLFAGEGLCAMVTRVTGRSAYGRAANRKPSRPKGTIE